jgi:hypothetical protein
MICRSAFSNGKRVTFEAGCDHHSPGQWFGGAVSRWFLRWSYMGSQGNREDIYGMVRWKTSSKTDCFCFFLFSEWYSIYICTLYKTVYIILDITHDSSFFGGNNYINNFMLSICSVPPKTCLRCWEKPDWLEKGSTLKIDCVIQYSG